MSVVLGIDSAFHKAGWALVERSGPGEVLIGHGVLRAVDWEVVSEFSGRMAHGQPIAIDVVVIEDAYLDKNVDTVKALSRLVGRWQQAFEALGVTTRLVMADVWQRAILTGLITGAANRQARKKAAQIWAKATYHKALSEDEADAAALATFEMRQRRFNRRAGLI